MRILVTGGAGFIGSNVADRFLALGHDVAVLDNLSTGRAENVDPRAKFYKADLVDHHAAQIDVRHSVENPVFDATTNLLGGIGLLESCVRHGVKKFVYASTGGALYGEGKQLPATEDHPAHPESPYGCSKLSFEH